MTKAQGSLEYLLILAAILAIAVVVVLVATAISGATEEPTIVNEDKYQFAVQGLELVGYSEPYDGTEATGPMGIKYQGKELTIVYMGEGSIPIDATGPIPLGDDGEGNKFNVYLSADGETVYISTTPAGEEERMATVPGEWGDTFDDMSRVLESGGVLVETGNVRLGWADWWDDSWGYRKELTVTNNDATPLYEYQVGVQIDTAALIFEGKMQSDCSDMEWRGPAGDPIDFYLESCGGTAIVWVKIPEIPAGGDAVAHMYYGNAGAPASRSSEAAAFSYSEPRAVGYVVSHRISSNGLQVISLADGNTITAGASTLTLGSQGTGTFAAAELSMGTAITATKLFQADCSADGCEAISPISWAGTAFYYNCYRFYNYWDIVSPFGTATVSIKDAGNEVWSGTVGAVGASIYADIVDLNGVQITSDLPILVQHHGESGGVWYDSRLLYPATTDYLYGIPSSILEIGAGPDGASASWIDSAGNVGSATLGANNAYYISGLPRYGGANAYRVKGSYPIGVDQLADGDGGESTTFLPQKEMGTLFGSAQGIEYIAIAAPEASTTCSLYGSTGSLISSKTGGTRTDVNKIGFGTGASSSIAGGGWKMACDKPVFAYFQAGADEETQLWTWKQMRQYHYPEPTYSLGEEEARIPAYGYLKSIEIAAPDLQQWDNLTLMKTESAGNSLTVSILNASNDAVIVEGFTGTEYDLSAVSITDYPSLKLIAEFYGDGASTSYLDEWKIAYTTV